MEMDNNTLLFGAVLIGGLWWFSKPTTPGENYFFVPGHGDVAESKLPALGYTKFNGQWFKTTDLQAAAAANGVTASGNINIDTQQGINIFLTLLNAGMGIATTIINDVAKQKADLIEQIETKYKSPASPSHMAVFPYTTTQLQAFTVAKLKLVLAGNMAVTGITNRPDQAHYIQCRDGNYTDRENQGACSHHRGVKHRAGAGGGGGGRAEHGQRVNGWIDNL